MNREAQAPAASDHDIRSLCDQINVAAYGEQKPTRLRVIPRRALQSVGFVIAFRLALSVSDVLVMQFASGAVALYLLDALILRLWASGSPVPGPLPEGLQSRDPFQLALLEGVLELQGARKRDFPIQQNALLALSLISISTFLGHPADNDPRWLFFFAFLAVLDFVIRTVVESRDQSLRWQRSARAIGAFLRNK